MILLIGEILMDMIGTGSDSGLTLQGKLGGAPLNVASDLADLGVETLFHGVIGKDIIGSMLLKQLEGRKRELGISLEERSDRQTTIALFLKDKGEFQFLRKLGADYCFEEKSLLALPHQKADIVHFGSLFLSEKKARDVIFSAIKWYKEAGKLISFDVNFRSDIFSADDDFHSYYKEMINKADIVKLTREELAMLTCSNDIEDASKSLGKGKIVLITDGSKGSYCFYKGKLFFAQSMAVEPVDTIGCGDSFMAGALSYLHGRDIDSLREEDIRKLLCRGNACGRATCLVEGALHGYESLEEVEARK